MKKESKEKCNSSFGIGADIESISRFKKQACKDKNCRMGDKNTNNTQLNRWSSDFGDAYTRRNLESNFSKKRLNGMKDYLSKALVNMKGVKRILEVGCNTGHKLLVFSELGNFELVGIDPQISALKIGKEKGIPATLITGSVYDIHFFDGYFDLVVTAGVLMHIHRRDLPSALKEIDRVTSKYFLTLDYFDDDEVQVSYRGYEDMLWRRDMRKVCSNILPHMKVIWEKQLDRDPRTGKYTWIFLFEK